MVTLIALIRVSSIISLTACWAFCQSELPTAGLRYGSNASEVRQQEMPTWKLLPDAPSIPPPIQAEKFQRFVDGARSLSILRAVGFNTGVVRATEGRVPPGPQPSFAALYRAGSVKNKKRSSTFFGKYLYPSFLKPKLRYHPSTSRSFMGRASNAASRLFVTSDELGR